MCKARVIPVVTRARSSMRTGWRRCHRDEDVAAQGSKVSNMGLGSGIGHERLWEEDSNRGKGKG